MKDFKTIRPFILVAAIAGMTLSQHATAQSASARQPLPFSAYDQNSDGTISFEEFKAVREQRQAEGRPMRNAPTFAELDSNHDEKLTANEFATKQNNPKGRQGAGPGALPAFADFDQNKDGKITEEEFTEARTARISKRATEGYQMRGLSDAPAFADMDINHDGALSPEEFSPAQTQHRQRMQR